MGRLHIICSQSRVFCFLINMKMVKTLIPAAEKRFATYPPCRELIGVDFLRECHFSPKKCFCFIFSSTAATEALRLTNCVLEHNGASSHSFCAARSDQSELSAVLLRPTISAMQMNNSEVATKAEGWPLFICISTVIIL